MGPKTNVPPHCSSCAPRDHRLNLLQILQCNTVLITQYSSYGINTTDIDNTNTINPCTRPSTHSVKAKRCNRSPAPLEPGPSTDAKSPKTNKKRPQQEYENLSQWTTRYKKKHKKIGEQAKKNIHTHKNIVRVSSHPPIFSQITHTNKKVPWMRNQPHHANVSVYLPWEAWED